MVKWFALLTSHYCLCYCTKAAGFVNVDGCLWAGRSYLASAPVHALLHESGVTFDSLDTNLSV